MARNFGGRGTGASSRTSARARRPPAPAAAFRAATMAAAPPARNAAISLGRPGAAAARSTTSSPSTTPIRVAAPCVNVTSFMPSPVDCSCCTQPMSSALDRAPEEAAPKHLTNEHDEVLACPGGRGVDAEGLVREGGHVEEVAPCAQEQKEKEVRSNGGSDEAGALTRPYHVDEGAKWRAKVSIDEVGEPRTRRSSLTRDDARHLRARGHEADELLGGA